MTARLTDGHLSGKATANENQWLGALEEMRDQGCDRFSITEANGPAARRAIARFCQRHGWGVVHFDGGGKGECAILHNPRVLDLKHATCPLLTDLTLRTARKAPIYAPLAAYEHTSGAVDWRTAAHLPAHLEGRHGFRNVWPSKVHRAAVNGWRKALRDNHAMTRATVTGDFNINWRLLWVRAWAKAKFPQLRSAWRRPLPRGGTFKRRIIDLALTAAKVVGKARLVDPLPGMDHRGFVFVIKLDR